jgi:hypothetical protein
MNKEKKIATVKSALSKKVQDVKVVNKIEIAEKEHEPMKPSIHLSSDDLPGIANCKVGNKYTLTLEVEQTSMRQGSEYEMIGESGNDKKVSASFKVLSAKVA